MAGLVRLGVITLAGATGGIALGAVATGCAIYSVGGGLKWW